MKRTWTEMVTGQQTEAGRGRGSKEKLMSPRYFLARKSAGLVNRLHARREGAARMSRISGEMSW